LITVLSLITGVFIAALSEFIQLFVPGRAGTITDVIIDSAGYLCATMLMLLIVYLINKNKSNKNVQQ
ncbi:MAG: VanZ family protein, partial [Bacilli bacterium]